MGEARAKHGAFPCGGIGDSIGAYWLSFMCASNSSIGAGSLHSQSSRFEDDIFPRSIQVRDGGVADFLCAAWLGSFFTMIPFAPL